jgi:hypothetical protein
VAGYAVMRIDPAVVAISVDLPASRATEASASGQLLPEPSPDDTQLAFG